jgi:hypothetical protein
MSQPETRLSDACPTGTDPRDWARELTMRETRDAWRTPPVAFDANGPEVAAKTRAMPEMPTGAWRPVGYGAKAGDPCSQNGAPGVLRERDGWLYCELVPVGPSRAGQQYPGKVPATRNDTGIGDRSAQDAAWRELQVETANAWRNP